MRPTMRLTIPTLTVTAFFAGSSILAGPAAHAGEFPHRPIQLVAQADPGAPPIERGERSELAAWWQDRLNTWLQLSGSSTGQIVVDGWYGPNTEAATLEFQESTDEVPADGVVDPEDRVALHDAIVALGGSSPIDDGADDGTDDGPDDALPSGEFSADDTSAEGTATLTAQLSDVTTAARQVGDRIEFTFGAGDASGTVGYEIGYFDDAPAGASGEPVEVDGDALLQVVLRPAAGYDPATGSETYTGPDRVTFDDSLVISEAVLVEDFEGVMTWVIGTRSEAPFRVASSEDPTRVVVEISHETD